MNVDAMLSMITWKQFREWLTYSELEMLPDERMDWNFAHVVQTNLRNGRPLKEFRLPFGDIPRPQIAAQTTSFIEHQIDAWIFGSNSAFLAKDTRGR